MSLEEAKARFRTAVNAADPMKITQELVKESPFRSVGIALAAGTLIGLSGKKVSRALFPGSKMISAILRQLI